MKSFILLMLLIGVQAYGGKVQTISNIPSTTCSSTIPNTHLLYFNKEANTKIIRGMAPVNVENKETDYSQLVKWNITDILVLRDVSPNAELYLEEKHSVLA